MFFFSIKWDTERDMAFLGKVKVLDKFSFYSMENLHVFSYFRNQYRIIDFIPINVSKHVYHTRKSMAGFRGVDILMDLSWL